MTNRIRLERALSATRTGDIWLFRGDSTADKAIRAVTNAPVNHVGMAVTLDDLPPLMWHAELGKELTDVWTGGNHRGVQLHNLEESVRHWCRKYGQRPWLRQLNAKITPAMEDDLLRQIARTDGMPFPHTVTLASRWLRGRLRRSAPPGVTYCAEVVAGAYQAMGLLDGAVPSNYFDPGKFWSGDALALLNGATLAEEIEVLL